MTRDYVRQHGIWQPSAVPTAADIAALDSHAASLVNGDGGGTWDPASPIIIGGSSPFFPCFQGSYTHFDGGVTTKKGGRAHLSSAGLWPTWNPGGSGGTRVILCPLVGLAAGNFTGGNPNGLVVNMSPFGLTPTIPHSQGFTLAIPKRYLHQGAVLGQVNLHMSIANLGQGDPGATATQTPSFSFSVVGTDGSIGAASTSIFRPWQASTGYGLHDWVVPVRQYDGVAYQCTTAGTSGTSEPAWPGIGNTVHDGSCFFSGDDLSGQMAAQTNFFNSPFFGATDAYTPPGRTATAVAMSFSQWTNGVSPLIIDATQNEYVITVTPDGFAMPCVTFTCLELVYTGITSLQTE